MRPMLLFGVKDNVGESRNNLAQIHLIAQDASFDRRGAHDSKPNQGLYLMGKEDPFGQRGGRNMVEN